MNRNQGTEPEDRNGEELARLLKAAEQGDRNVLPELRQALDADTNLWKHFGNLAAHAEASLVLLAAGPNVLLAEALHRTLRAMKDELGGEAPSALDRLLAERVAACWLQTNFYDGLMAQSRDASEARLRMLQRFQDGAHRRYLTSLKTFAIVRKLLKPSLSPVQVATRLDRTDPAAQRGRVAIAGTVGVDN